MPSIYGTWQVQLMGPGRDMQAWHKDRDMDRVILAPPLPATLPPPPPPPPQCMKFYQLEL